MEAIDRAVGSLLGLFVGDAFGAQMNLNASRYYENFPNILEMDSKDEYR
jgi:ADP-ribosylglycohydrolase